MKGEDRIIELLMQSLQNQDEMKKDFVEVKQRLDRFEERFERMEERFERMEERFERMETRVGQMGERFNKVEWRHDDLSLKHEELRFSISQTNKMVHDLLSAVAAMVGAQTQVEARVRRLERPDDFGPQSAVA